MKVKNYNASYGISSISKHYNREMDEAFAALQGFRCVVDDVVIYGQDRAQHSPHVRQFLPESTKRNITLNLSKCKLTQITVDFSGFILSPKWYQIDTSVMKAIKLY